MKTFIIVLMLTGCTPSYTTPLFTEDQLLDPKENAVVYFYHIGQFSDSPGFIQEVMGNGKFLGYLMGGSFIEYVATPGKYKFHTKSKLIDHILEYDVESRGVSFMQVEFRRGTSSIYIDPVEKQEGLRQLSTKHWMQREF